MSKAKEITAHARHTSRPVFKGFRNKGKSMTMPGQAITPQEIIRAMTTGISPQQVYHDENLSTFQRMDPVEKIDYLRDLQDRNQAMRQNIEFQVNQLKAKQKLAEIKANKERIKQEVMQELKGNATTTNDDVTA